MSARPVARVFDLVDPASQHLLGLGLEEARTRLLSDDPEAVLGLEGSFALVARDGQKVRLARSLDRPLRYFLAKEEAGPALVVAERIDRIRDQLQEMGYVVRDTADGADVVSADEDGESESSTTSEDAETGVV